MSDEETPVQYDPRTDEYMCPSCGMMAPRLRYDDVNDVEVPRETCRFCGVPVPDLSDVLATPGAIVLRDLNDDEILELKDKLARLGPTRVTIIDDERFQG